MSICKFCNKKLKSETEEDKLYHLKYMHFDQVGHMMMPKSQLLRFFK